jgi:hypothetical protein
MNFCLFVCFFVCLFVVSLMMLLAAQTKHTQRRLVSKQWTANGVEMSDCGIICCSIPTLSLKGCEQAQNLLGDAMQTQKAKVLF